MPDVIQVVSISVDGFLLRSSLDLEGLLTRRASFRKLATLANES